MAEGKAVSIWDHRVILQQWRNTGEVAIVSTWRQAGSLPLLAVFCSVFQGGAVGYQLSAGTVELKRVVVGCWIKRQSVESWKTEETKCRIILNEVTETWDLSLMCTTCFRKVNTNDIVHFHFGRAWHVTQVQTYYGHTGLERFTCLLYMNVSQ